MCGKFTQMMSWGTLVKLADLMNAPAGPEEIVTPMRFASVIRRGANGEREVARMRWGFVPAAAKDPLGPAKHIHARAETLDTRPTFRDAFLHNRGLLVVRTFNEGKEISPSKTEQYVITPNDALPVAIAVIWERWVERNEGELLTFAMVTVRANTLIAEITDRMPAIIQPNDWAKWLGETPASVDELKALLVPFEGDWTMRPQGKTAPPPKPRDDSQPSLF
jgi:putative SOS response-associated peptidase YedK